MKNSVQEGGFSHLTMCCFATSLPLNPIQQSSFYALLLITFHYWKFSWSSNAIVVNANNKSRWHGWQQVNTQHCSVPSPPAPNGIIAHSLTTSWQAVQHPPEPTTTLHTLHLLDIYPEVVPDWSLDSYLYYSAELKQKWFRQGHANDQELPLISLL